MSVSNVKMNLSRTIWSWGLRNSVLLLSIVPATVIHKSALIPELWNHYNFTLWEKCDCCTLNKSLYVFSFSFSTQKRVSYIFVYNITQLTFLFHIIHTQSLYIISLYISHRYHNHTLGKISLHIYSVVYIYIIMQHSHNNNIISIVFGIPNHMILVVSKIVQIAFHFCHFMYLKLYLSIYIQTTITLIYNKNRSHLEPVSFVKIYVLVLRVIWEQKCTSTHATLQILYRHLENRLNRI